MSAPSGDTLLTAHSQCAAEDCRASVNKHRADRSRVRFARGCRSVFHWLLVLHQSACLRKCSLDCFVRTAVGCSTTRGTVLSWQRSSLREYFDEGQLSQVRGTRGS